MVSRALLVVAALRSTSPVQGAVSVSGRVQVPACALSEAGWTTGQREYADSGADRLDLSR